MDPTPPPPAEPAVQLHTSRHFTAWLTDQRVSLAFTTYQAGKLFLIGTKPDAQLSVFERTFTRCMGLFAVNDQTLWMSSLFQIWRFENALAPGQSHQGFDRLFIPRVAHTTGDLDVHDLAVESTGRVLFVNTRFNCLATLSDRHSFTPLWRPPFISSLTPEDRCHLNGLALQNGKARFMTAVSTSDILDGWRNQRPTGGILIDVTTNQIIARDLSMPHSPRVYRDRIYILNSGTGHFGTIDPQTGKFESITFCPGYMRGLAFSNDHAIIALSKPRHEKTFTGLQLEQSLKTQQVEPHCGLHIINLKTGQPAEALRLEGKITELYDVATLPQVKRPTALGLKTEEIHQTHSASPPAPL